MRFNKYGTHVIIAPHVDDEVIGCYSLLKSGAVEKVIYITDFDELTFERKAEAVAAGEMFSFTPVFCSMAEIENHVNTSSKFHSNIYLPNIADNHPHHKAVNRYVRCNKIFIHNTFNYYSIDMNKYPELLKPEAIEGKMQALKTLYPSQVPLFESDAKYYLFESIVSDEGNYTVDLLTDTPVRRVSVTYDGTTSIAELTSKLYDAILDSRCSTIEEAVALCRTLFPNTKVLNIQAFGISYDWSDNA